MQIGNWDAHFKNIDILKIEIKSASAAALRASKATQQ
jgi:hypothetical protein